MSDRRALTAVATQFFVNGAVLGSVLARVPEIREQVGITLAEFGLITTGAGAVALCGSVMTSSVIGWFGTRRVLIVGGILQTASLLVIGFAASPLVFLLGMAAMALFDVLVDVSMNLQVSWLSARRRVPVVNRVHGLWSLGTLAGGAAAAQLASLGVDVRYHLIGATALLWLALGFVSHGLLRVDEQASRAPTPDGGRPRSVRTTLVLFAMAGFGGLAVEMIPNDWSALRLSEDLGAGAGAAALGFVAVAAGMTTGRMVGDSVMAAVGRDVAFRASSAVAGVGFVFAGFSGEVWVAYIGFALVGLGVATFFPTMYDDAAQAPGRTGAALGALTAGSRLAVLTVPVVVGSVSDTSWSVGATIAVASLTGLAILTTARVLS